MIVKATNNIFLRRFSRPLTSIQEEGVKMRLSIICVLLIVMTMVGSEKLQYNRIPMNEALRSMQTRNRLPREPKSDFLSVPEEGAQIPFRITDEVTTEVPLDSELQSKSDQLRGEQNAFPNGDPDVQAGTSESVRSDRIPVLGQNVLRGVVKDPLALGPNPDVHVRVSEAIDEVTEPITDEPEDSEDEDDPEPTFSPSSFLNLAGTNPFQAYLPQLPQQFPISIGYPQITNGNPGYTLPTQEPIGYPQTYPVQVYPVYPLGHQGNYYPQVYLEQEDDGTTGTEPVYALRSGVGTGIGTRKEESGSGTGTTKKDDDKKTGALGGISDTGKLALGLGAGYLLYNHIKNQQRPQRPQYQQPYYQQQQPYYQPQPQYQPYQQQYQPYQQQQFQYQPSQPTYNYQPSTPSFSSSTSSFSSSTPTFTSSTPSFTSSTPTFQSSTPTFQSQPSFQSGNRPYSGVGSIYGRTEARTTEEDQSVDDRIIIRIPYLTPLQPPKRTKRSTATTDLSEDVKITYYHVPYPAQNPPLPVAYQNGIESRGKRKPAISDTGKLVLGLGAGYLLYNHVKNQQRPQYQPQPYYRPQQSYYQPQYQYQPSRPVYNYQPGYGYGK